MIRLICYSILFLLPYFSLGQPNQFTFSPIQFSFSVPEGFILLDSTNHTIHLRDDISRRVQQFIFTYEKNLLIFSFSTGKEDNTDWDLVYCKEADHFAETMRAQKPSLTFKNSFSKIMLGGQVFDKASLTGSHAGEIRYNHVKLSKHYKHYQVAVSYTFENEKMAETIETELQKN